MRPTAAVATSRKTAAATGLLRQMKKLRSISRSLLYVDGTYLKHMRDRHVASGPGNARALDGGTLSALPELRRTP
jgi:hypothetical protein